MSSFDSATAGATDRRPLRTLRMAVRCALAIWLGLLSVQKLPAQTTARLSDQDAIRTPETELAEERSAEPENPFERIPAPSPEDEELPPLEEELWLHGGSYMYAPEGDRLGWPIDEDVHDQLLRLPPDWQAPEPLTLFADFLGADPVTPRRPWKTGYSLDPRFVAYGSYTGLAFALESGGRRQDVIGHNLVADLDLRLTGTERFHVQFRPVGRRNTGGSYYQFRDPDGYVDNSTGEPDRYWFEGELHSLLGYPKDPLAAAFVNFVAGKFPFALHNELLMNDEIIGGVVSQNNLRLSTLSNLNLQLFVGLNDVDMQPYVESRMVGLHASFDHRRAFHEATYCYVNSQGESNAHYAAFSRTQFYGPLSLAGRALFKFCEPGTEGNAQLMVLESNYTRALPETICGFEHFVGYCNAFWASQGWTSVANGNFNRIRTAFEVNPLVRVSATPTLERTFGVALGAQFFRHHEDESIVPEVAWEQPGGEDVFGVGLRYLKKLGPRTFVEVLGVVNRSDDVDFNREGVFTACTVLF